MRAVSKKKNNVTQWRGVKRGKGTKIPEKIIRAIWHDIWHSDLKIHRIALKHNVADSTVNRLRDSDRNL